MHELKFLPHISNILKGKKIFREKLPENLKCDDLIQFKFSLILTVDIERSFSK
jgi:hypothetical protein